MCSSKTLVVQLTIVWVEFHCNSSRRKNSLWNETLIVVVACMQQFVFFVLNFRFSFSFCFSFSFSFALLGDVAGRLCFSLKIFWFEQQLWLDNDHFVCWSKKLYIHWMCEVLLIDLKIVAIKKKIQLSGFCNLCCNSYKGQLN